MAPAPYFLASGNFLPGAPPAGDVPLRVQLASAGHGLIVFQVEHRVPARGMSRPGTARRTVIRARDDPKNLRQLID